MFFVYFVVVVVVVVVWFFFAFYFFIIIMIIITPPHGHPHAVFIVLLSIFEGWMPLCKKRIVAENNHRIIVPI